MILVHHQMGAQMAFSNSERLSHGFEFVYESYAPMAILSLLLSLVVLLFESSNLKPIVRASQPSSLLLTHQHEAHSMNIRLRFYVPRP